MNLIICGFHYKSHFPIIQNVLEFLEPEFCLISYDTEKMKIPPKSHAVFLKDQLINSYANYPIKWSRLLPIDEELINKMSIYECMILRMMDRLITIPGFETYEVRKMTYLRHLQYWNYIFSTKKIELVIFDIIPHQIYDYVIYGLCKILNIPFLIMVQTGVDDFTFFVDDINEFNSNLKQKYHELLHNMHDISEEDFHFQERTESHLKFQLSQNPMPFYTKNFLQENSIRNQIRKNIGIILHTNPLKLLVSIISDYRRSKNLKLLKKTYHNLAKSPDLTKKYVYFPLHVQPECSTCPMAGAYVDLLLIVKLLRYYLPEDVHVYVKEHVAFSLTSRSVDFYNEMARFPNTSLIQQSFSSLELIKNSAAVATATGTAAWEALFRQIPVFMFGSFFFEYAKGVYKIKSHNDIIDAVDHIFHKGEKPVLKDIKIYLKAMEETSINGYIGEYYKSISHLTPEQNIQNISSALIQKIKMVKNIK